MATPYSSDPAGDLAAAFARFERDALTMGEMMGRVGVALKAACDALYRAHGQEPPAGDTPIEDVVAQVEAWAKLHHEPGGGRWRMFTDAELACIWQQLVIDDEATKDLSREIEYESSRRRQT